MHDGLAQVLGYLSLQVQTLEALIRQDKREAALSELKQARANILEAQSDVRQNITGLRTTLAGEVGLLAALRAYVAEFEVQTGIHTALASTLTAEPGLSPLAEVQLVRIVQEALANVRKHARATRVQVDLARQSSQLWLQISDDGCGFLANGNGRGHYGLSMMRERAEQVGGALHVTTAPGAGTRVAVWLPLVRT
jgi:signal transduction histidine kinase